MEVKEYYAILEKLELSDDVKSTLLNGAKAVVSNLNEEAKTSRMAKEDIDSRFAQLEETNKAMIESIQSVTKTLNPEVKVEDANNSDIVKRLMTEIDGMKQNFADAEAKTKQAEEVKVELLKKDFIKAKLQEKVKTDGIDLLSNAISQQLVQAEDGVFQGAEGVTAQSIIDNTLTKYPSLLVPSSEGGGSVTTTPPASNGDTKQTPKSFTQSFSPRE